jgi:formamidopyrimidine-DNA glycosylase
VPEILEVESYRVLAEQTVGTTIVRGWADGFSAKKLPNVATWSRAVRGLQITATSRRGKLLLLDTDGVTLGVRFGMTGVLLLDQETGIEGLFYGPHTFKREWVRGGLELADGRKLILHDPRRLARFELDPDLTEMGPDALGIARRDFDRAIATERGEGPAVKARLLDQSKIAGVGNLLADEALFRAGVDPRRAVGSLTVAERAKLFRALGTTLRTLQRRGGSHTGDHMDARFPGSNCPLDGSPMRSATIGGRTTYWCSAHQR